MAETKTQWRVKIGLKFIQLQMIDYVAPCLLGVQLGNSCVYLSLCPLVANKSMNPKHLMINLLIYLFIVHIFLVNDGRQRRKQKY